MKKNVLIIQLCFLSFLLIIKLDFKNPLKKYFYIKSGQVWIYEDFDKYYLQTPVIHFQEIIEVKFNKIKYIEDQKDTLIENKVKFIYNNQLIK